MCIRDRYLSFGAKIAKISPVDPEIIGLQSKKRKKLRKVKYIARSASLPSGLKIAEIVRQYHATQSIHETKHLKNVGPIRHCEPPHALILHCHSPGVAIVARRLCIDVHDNDNDNA